MYSINVCDSSKLNSIPNLNRYRMRVSNGMNNEELGHWGKIQVQVASQFCIAKWCMFEPDAHEMRILVRAAHASSQFQ